MEKQKRFCDEYLIDCNDLRCFKSWNYCFLREEPSELIIDAYAVLLGDYGYVVKKAALLLLKILVRDDFLKFIMQDTETVYPFDRNDSRVRRWKKEVLKKGSSENCGSEEHLEAHHILGWAHYPMGRADIKNGECLCHKCHTEQHIGEPSYHMMAAKYK